MPYVPSRKTVPPAEDRVVLDPVVEALAQAVALKITKNLSLIPAYVSAFVTVARNLKDLLDTNGGYVFPQSPESNLAKAIYDVGAKHGYEGAFLGEFNYCWTRFIQLIPKIKITRGEWKDSDEFRYWYYACVVETLMLAGANTLKLGIGVGGVFEDIKDEYKWKANRAYEIAQIIKSGDCYDTPFYMRPIPVKDEEAGEVIGYTELALRRSPETVNLDVLNGYLVFKKNG